MLEEILRHPQSSCTFEIPSCPGVRFGGCRAFLRRWKQIEQGLSRQSATPFKQ
jgi:hypothetical protein